MKTETLLLNGIDLTPAVVDAIAAGAKVTCCSDCLDRMAHSNGVIQNAISNRVPVYGVTTGLGPKVVEALPEDALSTFSVNTIRGRAHAVGKPLEPQVVRAALGVRLNTLLIGASGSRPQLASFIASCLNKDAIPVVGETASIGAADLLWGATSALALIGEGQMWRDGTVHAASDVLKLASLEPWQPGPREGLALSSHSCFSSAIAALGLHASDVLFESAQTAAALTIEAFRANLSPIDQRVLNIRSQPGQDQAALGLRQRLSGSLLFDYKNARRLQDPLSIRNIVQVHGALHSSLQFARETVQCELNGATDNPAVVYENPFSPQNANVEILSHGGYLSPMLTISLGTLAQSMVHLAAQQTARIGKLLSQRFSDLPNGLAPVSANCAGLGPIMKVVEALLAEISHLANPPVIYPSPSADALEDTITHTAIPAKALLQITEKMRYLCAIEMLVACHAIRLRGSQQQLPAPLVPAFEQLAELSPQLTQDRSFAPEIEAIASLIRAELLH